MRTDSTHLSGESLEMARDYIKTKFGDKYLPEKANVYSSSNKDAQEAHEAIRPTDVSLTPMKVRNSLSPDQARLLPDHLGAFCLLPDGPGSEWDSTTALVTGGRDAKKPCTAFASGACSCSTVSTRSPACPRRR